MTPTPMTVEDQRIQFLPVVKKISQWFKDEEINCSENAIGRFACRWMDEFSTLQAAHDAKVKRLREAIEKAVTTGIYIKGPDGTHAADQVRKNVEDALAAFDQALGRGSEDYAS